VLNVGCFLRVKHYAMRFVPFSGYYTTKTSRTCL